MKTKLLLGCVVAIAIAISVIVGVRAFDGSGRDAPAAPVSASASAPASANPLVASSSASTGPRSPQGDRAREAATAAATDGRDAPRAIPTPMAPIHVPGTAGAAPATSASPATRDRAPGAPPPARPHAASEDGDGTAMGTLVDQTGWGTDLAKQLNRELMPLVTECIGQAQARTPGLHGLLVLEMTIAPTDDGNAIFSSVKRRATSEVDDPELLECLRQSSFAMEGLHAPHDFDISIPITPPPTH